MRILNTGKRLSGFTAFLFGTALLCGAFFFPACETGFDPDTSIPLARPASIQVTAGDHSLVLQWTKVARAQGVIPSYKIYYSEMESPNTADEWREIESNTSNLVKDTITDLHNHTLYYIWVKAVYAGLGESDFSPVTSGTPIPPPAIPGTLTITPSEAMLQVTWAPVADAFTYEVYYQAGGTGPAPPEGAAMTTVSEAGAALSGLTNGTSYTLWVRAANTAGTSSGYATETGTPQAATAAPATAPDKPEVIPGTGKLTLLWAPVAGVPNYKLWYGTTEDFSPTTATAVATLVPANVPQVRADIPGLTNGTLYYVWVQSWNSSSTNENSPVSEAASGTPVARDPVDFTNLRFELGQAAGEYIFAQDLPNSVFFPGGNPNTDRLTRVQETTLGNLFTDGAAWYARNRLGEDIDFVFLNGGYIDNYLPKGTVTVGSFSGIVQPDSRGDKFVFLTLTGADLKKFFMDVAEREGGEGDVSGVVHTGRGGPHNTGYFGVVSKEVRYTLQYYPPPGTKADGTYDAERAYTGDELTSLEREEYLHGFIKEGTLKINGEDIDDNRSYRICTTDYLARGDYFTILYEKGTDREEIATPFWHGVAEYIYDQGTVTPALDGRIKVEGGVPLPPPWVPGDLIKP
jgi:hypothetical protein